jgi:chemosensory pili system protein ChpA (sensor histidine kinase/response regulator)
VLEAAALEQPWHQASASAPVAAPSVPAPARTAVSDESLLEVTDDLDDTILSIFIEEANELLPQAGEEVRAWRRAPDDASSAAQLRRTLHTLKGSARMAGAMRLGELAHRMESKLSIGDTPVAASAERIVRTPRVATSRASGDAWRSGRITNTYVRSPRSAATSTPPTSDGQNPHRCSGMIPPGSTGW